ncbi:MAG TPA: hypothetical protein VGB90_04950 [Alphaproteobacteria bacterium]|jgi:hypothetical protein
MNVPEWVKPGLYGAAVGAVVLAVGGFSWGGWVTGGTAERMAADKAREAIVTALVPICVEQAKQDPQVAQKLASIKKAQYYDRDDMIAKAGWATMPGATAANDQVARVCAEQLAAAS